jgi:hypothetical protein
MMDTFGPFDIPDATPLASGEKRAAPKKGWVIVIVDYFTKIAELCFASDHGAETAARLAYEFWLSRYPKPEQVTTDNGTEFQGSFATMLHRLGIKHINTAVFHPQANGACERLVGTFKHILQRCLVTHKAHWVQALPLARAAYMRNVHSATGFSPIELLTGIKPEPLLPFSELLSCATATLTEPAFYSALPGQTLRLHVASGRALDPPNLESHELACSMFDCGWRIPPSGARLWCDCFSPAPYEHNPGLMDRGALVPFKHLQLQNVDIQAMSADLHFNKSVDPREFSPQDAYDYVLQRQHQAAALVPQLHARLQDRQHLHRHRQEELILRRAHWSRKVHSYAAGDFVLVSWKPERTGLNPTFRGPFLVERITTNGNVIVRGSAELGDRAPTWSVKPQRLMPYHYDFQCIDPQDAQLENEFVVDARSTIPASLSEGIAVPSLVLAACCLARQAPARESLPTDIHIGHTIIARPTTPRVRLKVPCAHWKYI